jgi:hypothetical protein
MNLKRIFIFLLVTHFCRANMASPILEGSKNATAFSSKNVAILHENILVHISQDFKTAKYTIEYTIKSDEVGGQIPLLFLARDYKDNFTVWLDGKLVKIKDIPNYIIKPESNQFADFANSFTEKIDEYKYISITWQRNNTNLYNLDDLKYFEANLTKGEHKIKVEYSANVWIDKSNEWVNEYSFSYSLAPAKYWKSFGGLDITVFQDGNIKPLVTNLGNPIEGNFDKVSTWKFNKLPSENFNIIYKPNISQTAKALITIEPFGIMILVGIVLLLFHIAINFWYRKKNRIKKYSWVVVLGSFIVPYLMFHSYFISYDSIDNIIGVDASKRHGYYFLILFWYPVLVAAYMIIMWIIDVQIRKKILNQNQ